MADIAVTKKENDLFEVTVGDGESVTTHEVTLDDAYWEKLTGGSISKEALIEKSFAFLLAREPKESILREFHLSVIGKYFPEYEREVTSH